MTTGAQTHKPAQLRKARIDVAEQDYRAAAEEVADAAMLRGAELEDSTYTASGALRLDTAARGLFRTHAALVKARGGK